MAVGLQNHHPCDLALYVVFFNLTSFPANPHFLLCIFLPEPFYFFLNLSYFLLDLKILVLLDNESILFLQVFDLFAEDADELIAVVDLLLKSRSLNFLTDYPRTLLGLDMVDEIHGIVVHLLENRF
jgi:hypothetical protein